MKKPAKHKRSPPNNLTTLPKPKSANKNRRSFSYVAGALVIGTLLAFAGQKLMESLQEVESMTSVNQVIPRLEKRLSNFATTNDNLFSANELDLLWGTYRPHLYFGMRTRVGVDSVVVGLMWFRISNNQRPPHIFHVAKSENDVKFTWIHHNGRNYGKQVINDNQNKIKLTIVFWKDIKGDWVVRAQGDDIGKPKANSQIAIIYYIGISNSDKGSITLLNAKQNQPFTGPGIWRGSTPLTGSFHVAFLEEEGQENGNSYWVGLPKRANLSDIDDYMPNAFENQRLRNIGSQGSDLLFIQKIKTAPFQVDLVYRASDSTSAVSEIIASARSLSQKMNEYLAPSAKEFEQRFAAVFPMSETEYSPQHKEFAMSVLSNLIGGIGYFYGQNRIKIIENDWNSNPDKRLNEHHTTDSGKWVFSEGKNSLFTATPSRKYFPRGFVWDEGFHQIVISKWDKELSKDMIAHWLKLIQSNGWIAREQILGDEAERRVPQEFIGQYPDHGNPPTIHLAIQTIIEQGERSPQDDKFFKASFKNLLNNFIWFLKTQQGERQNSFRWRGAQGMHTFACGLDDYPRFINRTIYEEHLDLACWVAQTADTLERIAARIGVPVLELKQIKQIVTGFINESHWNEAKGVYSDVSSKKGIFSTHVGYVTLFPFLFGLIPHDSDRLAKTLNIIEDPKQLWSQFGLRSLSLQDKLFGKGENYWRGNIWININYLVLRSLKTHYWIPGPHFHRVQDIYSKLRKNIVTNMYDVYQKEGTIFENYHPKVSKGNGQHPFTGWSSLVVLIMAELY